MAEIFDLTADSGDEQPATRRTDAPIDLTKESDDEGPLAKRARQAPAAADGPIKIVAWNASGILPKSGKNRDKLARLVQRLGRVDAICVTECTVKRGDLRVAGGRCSEEAAARALLSGYTCHGPTHVQATGEHKGAGVLIYVRNDSPLARNGRLLPSPDWDRWGMVGQYVCDAGDIVWAYLPTPTRKKDDAALRAALDEEWPRLVRSHRTKLLCFCGDLNATLDPHLDATPGKWFNGTAYRVSREVLQTFIRDNYLIDVVRNKWPSTVKHTYFPNYENRPARPDHFLVPMGRATLVEDVVIPDRDPRFVDRSTGHYKSQDKEGTLCGSDHVPIVVTMRLS